MGLDMYAKTTTQKLDREVDFKVNDTEERERCWLSALRWNHARPKL